MGPFLDAKSAQLVDGDICYAKRGPEGQEMVYCDYKDMMKLLMKLIEDELKN